METSSRLNFRLLAAAVLMTLTSIAHIWGGGPEFYDPLRASTFDPVGLSGFSVVWHMVTWMLILTAGALLYLSFRRNLALLVLLVLAQAGFALLFICYGWVDLGNLSQLPQWTVFALGAGLGAWVVYRP